MAAAGWQRIDGPGSTYEHPDGGKISLDNWTLRHGMVWRHYAAYRQIPEPGKGRIDEV